MHVAEGVKVGHNTRMHKIVEAVQLPAVGEDYTRDAALVNTPVRTEDLITKQPAHFGKESRIAIVGSSHIIGHEGMDTAPHELGDHGAFTAAYPAGYTHSLHGKRRRLFYDYTLHLGRLYGPGTHETGKLGELRLYVLPIGEDVGIVDRDGKLWFAV
jgi:hypothetical protein